jgi:hypothetical protein
VDAILYAVSDWPGAVAIRESWVAYIFVNAAHILGIGLLLGSILPLDLRLMGFFRSMRIEAVGPFLLNVARTGFLLAAPMGLWLFSVKPQEYVGNAAFLFKAGLLGLAFLNIVFQHSGNSFRLALSGGEIRGRVRASATISFCVWLAVLVAGRWIGFV